MPSTRRSIVRIMVAYMIIFNAAFGGYMYTFNPAITVLCIVFVVVGIVVLVKVNWTTSPNGGGTAQTYTDTTDKGSDPS